MAIALFPTLRVPGSFFFTPRDAPLLFGRRYTPQNDTWGRFTLSAMPTHLTDATQTQTMATLPVRHAQGSEAPPPPPPEAVRESIVTHAIKMRSVAQPPAKDGFSSKFAPWKATGTKAAVAAVAEPPVFTIPVDERKVDELRTTLGIMTGRLKATVKDKSDVATLFGALDDNDPMVRATRQRRTTGSALSFGQRALQAHLKSREGGAYVVLRIETEAERFIELRLTVQRQLPQSGRTGSFIEVIGSAPVTSSEDVKVLAGLRDRLESTWGRKH